MINRTEKTYLPYLCGFLALSVFACGCRTTIHEPMQPMKDVAAYVSDEWIGLTDLDSACYLLILRRGGGVLYSQYWNGKIIEHKVVNWKPLSNGLRCEFSPDTSPDGVAGMECDIREDRLVGHLVGSTGWHETIIFRRERMLSEKLARFKSLVSP